METSHDESIKERYTGHAVPGDVVVALGRSHRRAATQGMTPHQHHVWEVHLLVAGEVSWFTGNQRHDLSSGSVMLVPPGMEHGAVVGRFEPSDLAWVQFDLQEVATAASLWSDQRPAPGLRAAWSEPDLSRLVGLHDAMMAECREPKADSPDLLAALAGSFIAYVARRACEPRSPAPPQAPAELRLMLRHIEDHLDRRVDLLELSELSGLSRSRIHSLFREHLGQSPASHALQRRLQRAQQLLSQGRLSVGQVAISLGFSSSQHFATAFRRRFGVSPSIFRDSTRAGVA